MASNQITEIFYRIAFFDKELKQSSRSKYLTDKNIYFLFHVQCTVYRITQNKHSLFKINPFRYANVNNLRNGLKVGKSNCIISFKN